MGATVSPVDDADEAAEMLALVDSATGEVIGGVLPKQTEDD